MEFWKKAGSKKQGSFTVTGIEVHQNPNASIALSQSYVGTIPAIKIDAERRSQTATSITEEEKQQLRGFIDSFQYACDST